MSRVSGCSAFLLAMSTCLFVPHKVAAAGASVRPNFVIILIDDLGYRDLGCYGQSLIATPNVDRLASQGMRWTDAYSSCPVCSPTRVALLTGKNPARVHFTGHVTAIGRHRYPPKGRIIPPDDLMHIPLREISLAEALKPAGYVSASIGKWHVGPKGFWPTDQGFDINVAGWTHGSPPSHFFPYKSDKDWNPSIPTLVGGVEGEYLTDRLTDEANAFVEDCVSSGTPFLLYLSHYAVHTPLEAPASLVEKYKRLLPGDSMIDPVYAAMVERVDAGVGRVLALLDRLNVNDETIVVFTSDNGGLASVTDNRPLRAGKGFLYEGGIRVPLIIRWPGQIDAGAVCRSPVITEDLYKTIVESAGRLAAPGAPLDGRSLRPDFDARLPDVAADLHWYYPHYSPQAKLPGAAIRRGAMKLIEFYDPPRIELYDLANDVGESRNLANERPEQTSVLLAALHAWLDRVDPIRHTLNPAGGVD